MSHSTKSSGKLSQRLSSRLLAGIIFISFSISVLMISVQLFAEYRNYMDMASQTLKRIEEEDINAIVQSAWYTDHRLLGIMLEGIGHNESVRYISVNDPNEHVLAEYGVKGNARDVTEHSFQLVKYINDKSTGIELGQLYIQIDMDWIYSRLKQQLIIIVLTQMAKSFIVSLFIIFLLNYLLTRHLLQITRYIGQGFRFPQMNNLPPLRLTRRYRDDELQSIVNTINAMKAGLNASMLQLEQENKQRLQAELEARSYADYLLQIFDSMSDALVVIDREGRIQQFNQPFIALTGLDEASIRLGKTQLHDLIHLQLRDEFLIAADTNLYHAAEKVVGIERQGFCFNRQQPMEAPILVGIKALPVPSPIVEGEDQYILMLKDEQKEQQLQEANFRATHDYLTGAKNRMALETRLEDVFSGESESADSRVVRPLCLAVLDLDHFKQINDTLGHLQGDEVLIGFTRMAREVLGKEDFLARTGGDEFIILFVDTLENSYDKLQQFLVKVSEFRLQAMPENMEISASIGLTRVRQRTDNMSSLLERADRACYQAKKQGRGRVNILD